MSLVNWEFTTPDRENLTWQQTWMQDDKGLIKNYEVGRNLAKKHPELSEKAKKGELPALGYKGGSDKQLKLKAKYGALNYLAQWQALRGEDLNINLESEVVKVCSKTGIEVTFTLDLEKLKN
jgi:hypothetical protein